MGETAKEWAQPRWIPYNRKHRAKQGIDWDRIREATRHGAAKYRQDFTDSTQRNLELRCIREGHFMEEIGSIRSYYLETNIVIGASEGEDTKFVYVEHTRSGDVHGSPITQRELRHLGVQP